MIYRESDTKRDTRGEKDKEIYKGRRRRRETNEERDNEGECV